MTQLEQDVMFTLTRSELTLVRKALQRYRARIEEVGMLGWYDNSETTRQEIARVDTILEKVKATDDPSLHA